MIKLLEYITRKITGSSKIKVSEEESDGVKVYEIRAPQEVMGILIGKSGNTVRAIRSLARARAIVDKENISIKLEEV